MDGFLSNYQVVVGSGRSGLYLDFGLVLFDGLHSRAACIRGITLLILEWTFARFKIEGGLYLRAGLQEKIQ